MSWHGQILPYEDRDDWLAQRRAGIGASDVAGILGVSPYASPFSVWADKVHGSEAEPSEAMAWGSKLEGLILDEFTERTGLYIAGQQTLVAHPKFEWARATVDGLVYESDLPGGSPLGVAEAKSDGSFGRWHTIPDHHQTQIQWQLFVTGLDSGWLAVLHGRRFEVYEVEADVGLQNMMLDKVNEFRARHITGGVRERTPPDADSHKATTRAISDLWVDKSDTIELSTSMVEDVYRLRELKQRSKVLTAEMVEVSNRIKVSMQSASVGTINGEKAVTWTSYRRGGYTVDAADIRPLKLATPKEDT